jgi:DNA-directed RNA polymerase specialized sigma24 family protein
MASGAIRGLSNPPASGGLPHARISNSEADDVVQESWLRLSRSDASGVENLGGWLTTVVSRVCLDMLRSRESRHEEPLDVHATDPIESREDEIDPEHEALLADSVGLALLVVLND